VISNDEVELLSRKILYLFRVQVVAQTSNQYIVAFHITISYDIYSHTRWQQSSDADGMHCSIYWSDGSMYDLQMCSLTHSDLQTF